MKNLIGEVNWVSDQEVALAKSKIESMENEEKIDVKELKKQASKKLKEVNTLSEKLYSKLEELYELDKNKHVYDALITVKQLKYLE